MSTPIYEERDCPVCESRSTRREAEDQWEVCADCGKRIPTERTEYAYKNMGGQGFRSHTSDHRHTKMVRGEIGFGFAHRALCLECYRIDFEKFYPGEPLPV